ncbi:MAG TPA: hypothetical protein EYH58_00950 [Aquifex aeolicus]|nr:hypothetical protein [Aquifex aeolicus]
MEIQTLIISDKKLSKGDIKAFLKENYPDRYALLENWEELKGEFELQNIEGGKYLVIYRIPEEEFQKELGIFQSIEEAMGAFISTALEHGWEEVPKSYVIYHADFIEDGKKLIAGIKTEEGVFAYDQLKLEEMMKKLVKYPRIITYSSDVLTYIRDIYPDVYSKAYIIAREIASRVGQAPELEQLAKIYRIDASTLEGKLKLIEKLLENPVKLPDGREVFLRPYWYPLEET